MARISIIGAGSWGTALSMMLDASGHAVKLWAYEKEVCESIHEHRENRIYFPGVLLSESIVPVTQLPEALEGADIVLTVMPSHVCGSLYEKMLPWLNPHAILVSATKGIDTGRLMRMSEVIQRVTEPCFSPRLAVISGPSFAREVARGDPTALVVASRDPDVALKVQQEFSSKNVRLYTTDDVVGVELGGAVKNVIAIAAGVIEGLGLGHNPMAALITRGLAEMTRLACACGGRRETLAGLAGMGDLVLTCTGGLSRNRSVGIELGRGRKIGVVLQPMIAVAEGVKTTGATVALARNYDVEMPITIQVQRILNGAISPEEAIRELMERTLKDEVS